MLEAYYERHPKPKTIIELKKMQQMIWDSLPQGPINKTLKKFPKWLKAYVEADGGYFENSQCPQNSDALLLSFEWHYFAQTFLNVLKSLDSSAARLIILSQFIIIKCC